jgi:hypothetical protein
MGETEELTEETEGNAGNRGSMRGIGERRKQET